MLTRAQLEKLKVIGQCAAAWSWFALVALTPPDAVWWVSIVSAIGCTGYVLRALEVR